MQRLFERPEFWTIVATVLGYFLGEVSGLLREYFKGRRASKALRQEVEDILAQLPQKRRVLQNLKNNLINGRLVEGMSVHMPDTAYRAHFADGQGTLTRTQRNCIRVVYEYMRVTDAFLDSYKASYISDRNSRLYDDVNAHYIGMLTDMIRCYDRAKELIESFLCGKPIDTFPIDDQSADPKKDTHNQ